MIRIAKTESYLWDITDDARSRHEVVQHLAIIYGVHNKRCTIYYYGERERAATQVEVTGNSLARVNSRESLIMVEVGPTIRPELVEDLLNHKVPFSTSQLGVLRGWFDLSLSQVPYGCRLSRDSEGKNIRRRVGNTSLQVVDSVPHVEHDQPQITGEYASENEIVFVHPAMLCTDMVDMKSLEEYCNLIDRAHLAMLILHRMHAKMDTGFLLDMIRNRLLLNIIGPKTL